MSDSSNSPSPRTYYPVLAGLAALALGAIWLPDAPLGVDTPTHLLFARMIAAPELFGGWVETRYTPTSQLFVWLVVPLTSLGPVLAGKIGNTLVAALHVSGAYAVGRALGERTPVSLLVGLISTQSFVTAMGFSNFGIATGLALLALAAAIRAWSRPSAGSWCLLAVSMLVVAHGHVMVAGMLGASLMLFALAWPQPERAKRTIFTGLALAPAGVFSGVIALVARAEYSQEIAVGLSTQRLQLGAVLRNIAGASLGGTSSCSWPALVAIAIALFAGARGGRLRAPIALSVAAWGLLYFVVPYHGLGWAYAQPRVLVPLVVFTGVLGGWGRRPGLVLAALGVGGALHLGSATAEGVKIGRAIAGQLDAMAPYSGVGAVGSGASLGRVMEVVIDPGEAPNPDVLPLHHTGKYALWMGGITPLMPPYSSMIHSVRPTWEPPPFVPPFAYRGGTDATSFLRDRVPLQGLAYDHVVLVGADESWERTMRSRGYDRASTERTSTPVWRPRATALEVELALPPEAETAPLHIRAGYPETIGWGSGRTRPPHPVEDPVARISLAPLPAGPIVLEITLGELGDERVLVRLSLNLVADGPNTVRVGADGRVGVPSRD